MPDEPVIPNEEQDEPELIEIDVAGSRFKGTKDEVIEKLSKSVEHGNTTIKAQRDAHADLARTVAELKAPVPVANGAFDKDKYFKTLADDPVAAQDYLDEVRYGEPRAQLQQKWNEASQAAQSRREEQSVNRFMAAVGDEWPGTPEASSALSDHLKSNRLAITAENLALAYGELKASGAIKPAEKEPEEREQRRRPNPSARGGGGGTGGGKQPEELTTEQLRVLITKQGMARQ